MSHMQISLVGLSQDTLALRCRPKPQLSIVCPKNDGSDPLRKVQNGHESDQREHFHPHNKGLIGGIKFRVSICKSRKVPASSLAACRWEPPI
jgi:hypothetical protein